MARLYLIRHGKADATWNDSDLDPPLSEVGRAQAEARAAEIAGKGPLPLITSPLRRTRETAAAIERLWNVSAHIEPRIGEITAPAVASGQRGAWLKDVLQRRWSELDPPLGRWRDRVLDALLGVTRDTVLVSHFVAINVAAGYALGDDRVTCFHPDNCSCTVLDLHGNKLQVVELGAEGASRIL